MAKSANAANQKGGWIPENSLPCSHSIKGEGNGNWGRGQDNQPSSRWRQQGPQSVYQIKKKGGGGRGVRKQLTLYCWGCNFFFRGKIKRFDFSLSDFINPICFMKSCVKKLLRTQNKNSSCYAGTPYTGVVMVQSGRKFLAPMPRKEEEEEEEDFHNRVANITLLVQKEEDFHNRVANIILVTRLV